MPTTQDILDHWFGTEDDAKAIANTQSTLWWGKSAETDALIKQRFEAAVLAAASGQLDDWQAQPQGRMALILLTDQFTRNIYRDTPRSFQFDPLARTLCIDGLALQHDRALRPIERVFFYLPLEHSERRDDQARSVALMQQLVDDAPAEHQPLYRDYLDFALRHQVIVDRFGRFPHRNAILGRESTNEEQAFLRQPGSGF
jgi:uncharacterized protein (DUF924 family)